MISLEVAEGFRILPTEQNLFAANGSDIPVVVYACIPARLGNKRLEITGLVTEHVKEIMLGVDFLTDHKAMWDFTSKKIWIDGVSYPLYARQSTKPWSRRVILSGVVTVPAMSVMDVSAMESRASTVRPSESHVSQMVIQMSGVSTRTQSRTASWSPDLYCQTEPKTYLCN